MAVNIWLDPVDTGFLEHWPRIELHDGQEVLIGRHPQCQVRLIRETIGARHCSISHRDGVTWIKDLGTRYGVSVNGQRVDRASLAPGDLVRIGGVEYLVRERPSEPDDA